MAHKFKFYDSFGVEEYYLYDPDRGRLEGWLQQGGELRPIERMNGWRSPRPGIRFELRELDLQLYYPNGRPFLTFLELNRLRARETEARLEAEARIRELEAKLRQARFPLDPS